MRIGLGELLVILVLILIFFGPDKLTQTARKAGAAFRTVRRTQQTINRAKNPLEWVKVIDVNVDEERPPQNSPKKPA